MTTGTTQMTRLRRVGRINEDHRNTSAFGFVVNELPQLEKRPTVVVVPLGLADLCTLRNARQFFQGNLALRGLCGFHELLADPVVHRSHMALLSARQPFQKPFGFFRAFALERAPDFRVVATEPLYLRSFVVCAVRIDRDTPPVKSNTQRACGCVGRRERAFDLDMQEERAIAPLDQRGTGRRVPLESPLLVGTKRGSQPFPAVEQGQAEGPVPLTEAEDPLVIVHRGGLKSRMGFGLDLERCADTGNGPNRKVCRQPKAHSNFGVRGMLHLDLVARMDGACHVRNEVTGVRKSHQRCIQFDALLGGWRKFAGYRAYRVRKRYYITYDSHISSSAKAWKAFPLLGINPRSFHGRVFPSLTAIVSQQEHPMVLGKMPHCAVTAVESQTDIGKSREDNG